MERKPWKHYDKAVYWTVPDDGAKVKCSDCKVDKDWKEVILTQIPKNDNRAVICLDCIDEDWLKLATNLGVFPD